MTRSSRSSSPLWLTSDSLRRAAVTATQLLLVFLALWALFTAVAHFSYIVIPLLVALLLTALLEPFMRWLTRHRLPRGLALLGVIVTGLVVLGGVIIFVVVSIVNSLPQLRSSLSESLTQVQERLSEAPFGFDNEQITTQLFSRAQQWLSDNSEALLTQALGTFGVIGSLIVGLLVVAVVAAVFLYDGRRIWEFLLMPWQPGTRELVDDAGRGAFGSLVSYVRTIALVALIDAVAIGIGLVVLGVPLAIPLAALVFLGGFVPIVGAVASGLIAVGVSLVSNGVITALIVLALIVLVQQLEGNLLQPLLMGNFIQLHPLVVLLAIIVGSSEAGIVGALLAVPVTAALREIARTVAEHRADDPDSSTQAPSTSDSPG